ncbi:MAG TPA: hypothetical protein VGN72_00220 [Tepidisphaeraceae bacterium]|jgi:hypothetical protein|nr:hypothetical protein [Tepidisphaeraceae bacterium]
MAILINDNTATKAVEDHKEHIQRFLNMVKSQYGMLARGFWANRSHTPMAMAEAYGTDAAELFQLSSKLATFISDVTGEESSVVPAEYGYVINPDGTAVITLKEVQETVVTE